MNFNVIARRQTLSRLYKLFKFVSEKQLFSSLIAERTCKIDKKSRTYRKRNSFNITGIRLERVYETMLYNTIGNVLFRSTSHPVSATAAYIADRNRAYNINIII